MEVLPPYLLRAADVIQLTMLCELMAQAADISDAIAADPLNEKMRRLYLATCDRVQRLSGMFGLSPMDRMKMKAPSEPECDQLDDFTDMLSNVVKRN